MSITELLEQLRAAPASVTFSQVIETIDAHYVHTPTQFSNGTGDDAIVNPAGTNQGSCRIFAFAQLHGLSEAETLACFGQFYHDVLATPQGTDHANIRAFMQHGWQGIRFDGNPLYPK